VLLKAESADGGSQAELKRIMDIMNAGSAESLAANPRYQEMLARVPGDRLGHLYWDGGMIAAMLDGDGMDVPADAQRYLDTFKGRGAVAVAAGPGALNLALETLPETPPPPRTPPMGDALAALELLPADTLFAVGGNDAPTLAAGLEAEINRELMREMGMDTDGGARAVHPTMWLRGAFAAGMGRGTLRLPEACDNAERGCSSSPVGSPDAFFLAQVRDPALLEADLAQFDQDVHPERVTIGTTTLRQVPQRSPSDPYVVYGLAGTWFVVAIGDPNALLMGDKGSGLGNNPRYVAVQSSLSSDGVSFFVDADELRRLIDDLTPANRRQGIEFAETKIRPLVTPIRAAGGSWRTDNTGASHGRATLVIRK
jgi:hypothetical protein